MHENIESDIFSEWSIMQTTFSTIAFPPSWDYD